MADIRTTVQDKLKLKQMYQYVVSDHETAPNLLILLSIIYTHILFVTPKLMI